MTINSGTTQYITAAQFLRYYDTRVVAELLSDTGVKVVSPAGDPILAELLQAACGEVEASALRGGRYTSDDLAALAASSTNHAVFLRKLCAAVCMDSLRSRRARVGEEELKDRKWVLEALKRLRQGEEIFGFVEVQEAGTTQSTKDNAVNRQARQGISTFASPFFGVRGGDRR